jgi:hypothetical protein
MGVHQNAPFQWHVLAQFGPAGYDKLNYEAAGWMYQILPFVEGGNLIPLREEFGITRTPLGDDTFVSEISVPVYICPSRGPRQWGLTSGELWQCGDYASGGLLWNGVYERFVGELPDPPKNSYGTDEFAEDRFVGIISRTGAGPRGVFETAKFTKWSPISFGAIGDGSSNTLLYMEKSANAAAYSGIHTGTPWQHIGELGGQFVGGYHTNGRFAFTMLADNDDNGGTRKLDPLNEQLFGSAHSGVAVAVFGDGSSHAVNMNIETENLVYLGWKDDGTVLEEDLF